MYFRAALYLIAEGSDTCDSR